MTGTLVIDGAAVLAADGSFAVRQVVARDGLVTDTPPAAGEPVVRIDGTGRWLTPGFVDAHTHLAWGAFEADGRPGPGSPAARDQAALAARATLRAGVTAVRDAGGLPTGQLGPPAPRVQLSIAILGAADARGPAHLRDRVQRLVAAGADWIKVAATGGVGAAPDRVLEPVLTRAELAAVVAAATRADRPVMVHAWGGEAVDWAIGLGVRSLEHAVHLTARQAGAAAAAGVTVVPTVAIYHQVLAMATAGEIDPRYAPAARAAVAAHPGAVRACLAAGVRLATGTDAGTNSQHGRNLAEVATLIETGVPAAAAVVAGTYAGARLLGLPEPLRPGSPADLVVFDGDPRQPGVLRDRAAVRTVVLAGEVVVDTDTPPRQTDLSTMRE